MEWKTVKLGDIAYYAKSKGKQVKLSRENYVSTENMLPNGGGLTLASSAIPENYTEYQAGDTLISNIRPYFKKIWFADKKGGCSNDVLCIRGNEKVVPLYLFYLLKQDLFFDYIMAGSKGTKMPRGDKKQIMQYSISLPPLAEQKRIAAILSSLDAKIDNNNRINANLEAQAKALYKSWFIDFEPFGGSMPDDWKEGKLGDVIELFRGVSYTSKDIKDGDYALLSMNNIRPWGGFLYDFSRKYSGRFKEIHKLHPYDLIMCITDITQERRLIGYTAIIPPSIDNLIMCTHLLKVKSEMYDSIFLSGLFNYSGLSRFLADCATGTTVLGLTADIVKGIDWVLPTKEIAHKYSATVKTYYEQIFANNQESQRLAALRDTLLPKLMKGEIAL